MPVRGPLRPLKILIVGKQALVPHEILQLPQKDPTTLSLARAKARVLARASVMARASTKDLIISMEEPHHLPKDLHRDLQVISEPGCDRATEEPEELEHRAFKTLCFGVARCTGSTLRPCDGF